MAPNSVRRRKARDERRAAREAARAAGRERNRGYWAELEIREERWDRYLRLLARSWRTVRRLGGAS